MAVAAAAIFAEKVLPFGARLTVPIAVCLLALGTLIAVAPERTPGLTQPDQPAQSPPMSSGVSTPSASTAWTVTPGPPIMKSMWISESLTAPSGAVPSVPFG